MLHPQETFKRRLAAIVFADVAGWSSLIERDDEATLRAWKSLRSELLEPSIALHGGRLIETAGDSLLIEFPSAVAAVAWAVETQRRMPEHSVLGIESPLAVRIGINVEDVIVDEDRLIGNGVNVAARIHQVASPGEIVATETVRAYVWNKLPVRFTNLGERELKNISRRVRVYRIESHEGGDLPAASQPHLSWEKRPTIAVLPFQTQGGSPEDSYFGEGITEDIIGGLSRSHALYVIARNSTLRYRDRLADLPEIASALGVRYVLQGTVRRSTSRLRISAELVDAVGNRTLWADKFDGTDEDIFRIQDQIAGRIVATIEPRLYQAESARAFEKPTESLGAYECLLRALRLLYTFNDRDFAEAGRYLERAVQLDPNYAQAHAYRAWWFNLLTGEGRSLDPATDAQNAASAAQRAVELDPEDAFCLAVAAHIQAYLHRNLDAAAEMFDRAVTLNENCAFAWGVSGSTYSFLGRPDEALARLRNAWRLSPFDPMNFFFWTVAGIAEFVAARYDQAIGWLRKAERSNRRFVACQRTLIASLSMSGDIAAAQRQARHLLDLEPRFRVSAFISRYPLRRPDDLERLARGLRTAGLPE
jgi:adenylate cyclase